MNKIKIVNDKIEFDSLDDSIEISFKENNHNCLANTIKLIIKMDTELDIEYNIEESSKLDCFINIQSDVNVNIYEHVAGNDLNIQYRYYLEENSNCKVYKTSHLNGTKEYTIVNLNGENSKIKRVIKTISNYSEQYDMMIYHNAKNTESNCINHGVNIGDGNLSFNVSSFVPKDITRCIVDQNNRIINLTDKECIIKPNMYIDCYDVVANHSAFVGSFNDDEMFYLQSRGIPYEDALKLLIHGFLISNLPDRKKEDFAHVIDQYWR